MNNYNNRFFKIIKITLIFIILWILYAVFISITGLSIPCIFYEKTNLYCPGCGISRMFIKLCQLDFYGAFRSNSCIFIIFPLLICYGLFKAFKYVKSGKYPQTKIESIFIWSIVVILVLFGILRNIPYFSYLAPL